MTTLKTGTLFVRGDVILLPNGGMAKVTDVSQDGQTLTFKPFGWWRRMFWRLQQALGLVVGWLKCRLMHLHTSHWDHEFRHPHLDRNDSVCEYCGHGIRSYDFESVWLRHFGDI